MLQVIHSNRNTVFRHTILAAKSFLIRAAWSGPNASTISISLQLSSIAPAHLRAHRESEIIYTSSIEGQQVTATASEQSK
jgi:hypothetical protein